MMLADTPYESGREVESPFQREVAALLRERGYEVHDEVASGGKFIDIGVVDPERPGIYLLGIECDGASYHSARSARDRDRLRETHLESLGWRLHRIWSTDWFRDPGRALNRAIEAIERAKSERSEDRDRSGRDMLETRSEIERLDAGNDDRVPEIRAYEMAQPFVSQRDAISLEYASEPVAQVVRVESPVHIEEVMSRIAKAAGVNKTKKVRASLLRAVKIATSNNRDLIVRKDDFLWLGKLEHPIVVRDRNNLPQPSRKIEYIVPEEIAEAVKLAVDYSKGISSAELPSEALGLLGFKRVSKTMREHVNSIAADLARSGALLDRNGHLTIP